MNAPSIYRVLDQISYWSGKTFAWLIVALTLVVSIEVFKRYILNAPTAWIFDFNNMLYGTLFMMCGAYTLAAGGHVRADFVYGLPAAAHAGQPRPRAVYSVLHSGHPGADLRGLRLRPRLLAYRRALHGDGGGAARLPLQVRDPDGRRARDAPGASRRSRAASSVCAPGCGPRGSRTSRRSTSSASSSPTASSSTRSRGAWPSSRLHAIDEAARHRAAADDTADRK